MIKSLERGTAVELDESMRDVVLSLWNDPAIVQTLARRNEYQVRYQISPHYIFLSELIVIFVSFILLNNFD